MITINDRLPNRSRNVNFKTNSEIKFFNKALGELTLSSKRDTFKPEWITTTIKNKLGKIIGKEIYALNPKTKHGEGSILYVLNEYQKKGFRFGELLRLSSIMQILKSGVSEFEIYSKDSAIYFHSKYKFIPAITDAEERDHALRAVVKNSISKEFLPFKKEAKDILKISESNPSEETQKILCREANVLLKNYIEKVLESEEGYKFHPFKKGMTMILRKGKIINNKDFFNDLFRKHHIDYQI